MVTKSAGPRTATRLQRRLFTLDEYERMIAMGILCDGERVELLGGEIVQMPPMGPRHASDVHFLQEVIGAGLPVWATVRVQSAIRLPPDFEPEPDLAVVHRRTHRYKQQHPVPDDIVLLVEVSDTSLAIDRDVKVPRYAAAGIPEVWLWDLPHTRVVSYREPKDGRYAVVATVGRGGTLTPLAFPDLTIAVDDILT